MRSLALGEEAQAQRLLSEALAVRREAGDDEAAEVTESQLPPLPFS